MYNYEKGNKWSYCFEFPAIQMPRVSGTEVTKFAGIFWIIYTYHLYIARDILCLHNSKADSVVANAEWIFEDELKQTDNFWIDIKSDGKSVGKEKHFFPVQK